MGMYTELIFGASLKNETPAKVINNLRWLIGDIEQPEEVQFDRGRNPLRGGSYYFGVCDHVSKMWQDNINREWILSTRANIKNYDSDIEAFLEWIKPYVSSGSGDREMYAIVTYEQGEPELYFLYDEDTTAGTTI